MGGSMSSSAPSEPRATVELLGEREFPVTGDQTILEASIAAGVPHYHACGGNAQCSTCRVHVERGAELLSPPSEAELTLAGRMKFPSRVRLACQTRVRAGGGRVQLHRIVRDRVDLDLFVRAKSEERAASQRQDGEPTRGQTPRAEGTLMEFWLAARETSLLRAAEKGIHCEV